MTKFNFFKPKGETGAIPATPNNINANTRATLELFGLDESVYENEYSNEKTYQEYEIVVYENTLYVCIQDITEPEEFNLEHWEKFSIFEIEEIEDETTTTEEPEN